MDIGMQTQALLQKAKKNVTDKAITEFQMDCRRFLRAVITKLLDKSPLKQSIVRNMACLNPQRMEEKDRCKSPMKDLLLTLCGVNRTTRVQADSVLAEYQDFLDKTAFSVNRLDTWFANAACKDAKYQNLWMLIRKLLVLSHGQSSVERGFSFNKETMVDNLSQRALKARRVVLDHIQDAGGVLKVQVTKKLLLAASSARIEYTHYLDEQRKLKGQEEDLQLKRKMSETVDAVKKQKKAAEVAAKQLVVEADQLCFQAQEQRSFTLVARSNQLRLTAKDKLDEASRLQTDLANLEEKLKSLSKSYTIYSLCF